MLLNLYALDTPQPGAQVAELTLEPRDLAPQLVACALEVQRHVERTMLGHLNVDYAQIAPLYSQQLLVMADLFDQQLFVHRFYPRSGVTRAPRPPRPGPHLVNCACPHICKKR